MKACYDGNKTIYVLGKSVPTIFDPYHHNDLIQIDIDTLEVTKVGQPNFYNDNYPVELHYFNTQIFAVIPKHTHLWTINPFNAYASQSFSLAARINAADPSCHDGKGRLYFYSGSVLFELNLTTVISQKVGGEHNPPKLDTMLYFSPDNVALVDGKWYRIEDNYYGSCLVTKHQ
ncbi:hypothetical protein SAMD00019534_023230 [Acytostelium subglobosum LB1]|uniref:hypothetical protein n=1 Tax=Acytostelium subglobosum LB1 TaxID=1410327 RepID=UPI000644B68C|nr:hypothetical protein SAMD00019534_023230 [Acytostelium subglobosum LB1]GAM19148.1 hypothetical protein SAMD00019534_023230 [Acytostelium subglobosum LB1]|eukprot:XP_012757075.1 hypothetical protein SAMD00019534_023230 [Acytostelium subglobosum LB1]